jgi:Haem-degrading
MGGAYLGSGDIALHEQRHRLATPFPTRRIEQLAYGKDLKGGMVPGFVHGIIAFACGLPIMNEDNVHIGGIGVSGGNADEDETCAQAGIDAAKDALKWVPAIRSRKGGDTEGAVCSASGVTSTCAMSCKDRERFLNAAEASRCGTRLRSRMIRRGRHAHRPQSSQPLPSLPALPGS